MSAVLRRLRVWASTARGKALIKHDAALAVAALIAQPAYATFIHGQPVSRDALVAATLVAVKGLVRQLLPVPSATR